MTKLVAHSIEERIYVTTSLISIYKDISDAYPSHPITWLLITQTIIDSIMDSTSTFNSNKLEKLHDAMTENQVKLVRDMKLHLPN
jgi:hypothetical protein